MKKTLSSSVTGGVSKFGVVVLSLCVLLFASCGVGHRIEKAADRYRVDSSIRNGENPVKTIALSPCKGLILVNYHYDNLFESPQEITILEVDPKKFRFNALDHKTFRKTSEAALEVGATAAINGTFYNMKEGGSECYLQIDGVVSDTTKNDNMKLRANGAVVIRSGNLSVEPWSRQKEQAYLSSTNKKVSVMATMPLLIYDGFAVEVLEYKGFSDKRHPRSVIFRKDGKICLMVIDGRHKGKAAGMTLDEVQRYLLSMDGGEGCITAVNLDGGGSSTLWLNPATSGTTTISGSVSGWDKPSTPDDAGILNHPSDNEKFDRRGERHVANSIVVIKR